MPQVTVYIREEDIDKWRAIQRKSEFISNALNGLSSNGRTVDFDSANLGSSPSEPAKTPTPVSTPLKESPAVIHNLAEVDEVYPQERELERWEMKYDPKRPMWSPFGNLPFEINPMNPKAICDPNLDPDQWMPLDVDERNAWLERQ